MVGELMQRWAFGGMALLLLVIAVGGLIVTVHGARDATDIIGALIAFGFILIFGVGAAVIAAIFPKEWM